MTRLVVLLALALAAVASVAGASSVAPACKASQLAGTFKVVPGSAGAGNIVYKLVVKNTSTKTCTVTGLPRGVLLDKAGKVQQTHIRTAMPGAMAILATLAHGKSSYATARFSPDVPGPGESQTKQCEPTSYWFRLSAPGGGTEKIALTPATPVCEHGQLQFRYWSK
jgi:Protein of unknown function (DUF4232)